MQLPNNAEPVQPVNKPSSGKKSVFSDPVALFFLMLSHWRLLIVFTLFSAAAGTVYSFLATPIYRAVAQIEILNESRMETRTRTQYERQERTPSRQLLLLNSQRLHDRVRQSLRESWAGRVAQGEMYPEVEVSLVRDSNGSMIDLIVDSVDPEFSKAYLEEMVEVYRTLRIDELREVNQNALSGLRIEEKRVLEELDAARRALNEFENENQVSLMQKKDEMNLSFINQLLKRQKAVKLERAILENQYESILGSDLLTIREAIEVTRETQTHANAEEINGRDDANSSDIVGPSRDDLSNEGADEGSVNKVEVGNADRSLEWEVYEQRLLDLQQEYEAWLPIRKPAHPRMVELKQEIETLRDKIDMEAELALRRFKARYQALLLQEAGIDKVLSSWEQEQSMPVPMQNTLRQLISRVNHLSKEHDVVYGRMLENTDTGGTFYLRFVRNPRAFHQPIAPQKIKVIILSLGLGGFLWAGIVFLWEFLKPGTLDMQKVCSDFHLTNLASVPRWDLLLPKEKFDPQTDKFLAGRGRNEIVSETYRKLRLNILNELGDSKALAIALTSPRKGDGKTFSALNLGLTFAWDGRRVLLIDCDLRRSTLTKNLLGEYSDHGISDCLRDPSTDPRPFIVQVNEEPLYLLPAGNFSESLPELVRPDKLRELIQNLHDEYDVVILDTAPVSILTETVLQCRATDGVVLVVDSMSTYHEVEHAMNELRGVRTIGLCTNSVDPSQLSSAAGYGGNFYLNALSAYEDTDGEISTAAGVGSKRSLWGKLSKRS